MQAPIGAIADKIDRNALIACAGCLMIAAGYGLASLPLAATIAIGLGNGMFHIGGGVGILNVSGEKSGALGIFVSPGAFGVYFGTLLGRGGAQIALPILSALLVMAGLVFALRKLCGEAYIENAPFSPEATPLALYATSCFFLVVCLRSYVGLAIHFPWRSAGYWGLVLVCAAASGKAAGGFLADHLGTVRTAIPSLGLAALLFLAPHIPAAGIVAILLFNMTMPVTLWAVAKLFPGAKGFSFGLLTFALFIGFLPVYLGVDTPPFWLFTILAAISLVLLCAGLQKVKR
jgi:FSR family fosmidomycin resistance protein-like MFS transporter